MPLQAEASEQASGPLLSVDQDAKALQLQLHCDDGRPCRAFWPRLLGVEVKHGRLPGCSCRLDLWRREIRQYCRAHRNARRPLKTQSMSDYIYIYVHIHSYKARLTSMWEPN